ncbi:MAG: SHOCT domain-containing protein [Planctomycetes bacterium]|nr:SHOCT domain-containing protein [Planctomycetota bacterium]
MPSANDMLAAFLWVSVAALAAIAGMVVIRTVRNWARRDEVTAPFTIQDLREMRARGELSDEEYEAMRAAILGHYTTGEPAAPAPAGRDEHGPPTDDSPSAD